jgi:hypothetical protein
LNGIAAEASASEAANELGINESYTETDASTESTSASTSESTTAKSGKSIAVTNKEAKPDSVSNYNSSCKFNFIFYFIYKVKYDENGEIDSASLNFEF